MKYAPSMPYLIIATMIAIIIMARLWTVAATKRYLSTSTIAVGGKIGKIIQWFAVSISMILIAFSAMRPIIFQKPASTSVDRPDSLYNFFFVVDSSPSMAAQDTGYTKTRLEYARDDMLTILKTYPHAQYSLITYSHSSRMDWPLSRDNWSVAHRLRTLKPYNSSTYLDIEQVNRHSIYQFLQPQIEYEHKLHPKNLNFIVLFSTGDPLSKEHLTTQGTKGMYTIPYVNGGAYFLYGTKTGGSIVAFIDKGKKIYVNGADDEKLIVSTDINAARLISKQLHVQLIPRTKPGQTQTFLRTLHQTIEEKSRHKPPFIDYYWITAAVGLLVLLFVVYFILTDSPIVDYVQRRRRNARHGIS